MPKSKDKTSSSKPAGEKKKPARQNPENTGSISREQHYRMVEEAAYLKAEKAGFMGDSMQYWLAAEKEIKEKFST